MKRILVAATVGVLACPASAERVTIELPARLAVEGGALVLGQLARLSSGELDLMRALVDLPVGRAPAPGRSVTIGRGELQRMIHRRLRVAESDVAWRGADRIELATPSATVGGQAIAGAAEAALRDWLASRSERPALQLQSLPRNIEVPAGDLELLARPLPDGAPRARMVVWIDVLAGGRFVRLVPVMFGVRAARQEQPATGEVANAPALRPARALPVVERGHWAVLRSGAGDVMAEARVEVLQDGRPGERVRVRPSGAGATLLATVVAPGVLEVPR